MFNVEKFLHSDLVNIYKGEDDFENLIRFATKKLIDLEYIHSTYIKAIKKREKEFPTGLATRTYGVAIPHTDPCHIKKPFIYIIKLEKPIKFIQMGTVDQYVDVKYVFLLGFKQGEEQLQLLEALMSMFTNDSIMKQLEKEDAPDTILNIVSDFLLKKERNA